MCSCVSDNHSYVSVPHTYVYIWVLAVMSVTIIAVSDPHSYIAAHCSYVIECREVLMRT